MPGNTACAVGALYADSLKRYGPRPMAVGWKTRAAQRLRFDKLVSVVTASAGHGISVNDLGCGYGAMFDYLAGRRTPPLRRYAGYDISEDMLVEARRRIDDPRASFATGARATRAAHYSFVSGTFNVKLDASDAEWTEYVKATLLQLSTTSTRGFAFNMLTTYVTFKRPELYYADPFLFFDFCKRNIAPYVCLLHDYPLYEWTITVRTDRR